MLFGLEARVRAGLSRLARSLAGMLCLLVAAVFLTLAAWMALSAAHGAQIAALVIGGVYLLLGAILIASTGRRRPVAPPPPPASVGSLAEAFLAGRAAGQAMGQGRERG